MAEARIRNIDWKQDIDLKNDLAKFVRVNLRKLEILDFMRKDYPMFAWSLRSLARRMQYFGIQFMHLSAAIPGGDPGDIPGNSAGFAGFCCQCLARDGNIRPLLHFPGKIHGERPAGFVTSPQS